ncbi:hypothetical protein [Halomarina litorea]|uniref:hypothetical protein n=1 Tax=Halomarina litorea TaxID=2961595 RepID=UPI0020C3E723|nr:hypothetical protein [Halomarina sp. BCD28]
MSESAVALLRGDEDTRQWFVSGLYAVGVLCIVAVVVLPGGAVGDTLYREVFPWALLGTPPVVSAISAGRGGGLAESLAIGVVPTAAFALFGRSEALVVGTTGTVAAICLGGALVGFVAGYAGRELLRLFQAH